MKGAIAISVRDEDHLNAHLDHFSVTLDQALAWVRHRLEASSTRSGWEHFDFRAPRRVGLTGLKTLRPWTRGDFWACRRGRSCPSHLIVSRKHPTRTLCVWGFWQDDSTFILHTLYPGRVAPREIHDPELSPSEMGDAVRFWARHAIIVSPSEWDA